jgi:RNA polymerase primary sigma factor
VPDTTRSRPARRRADASTHTAVKRPSEKPKQKSAPGHDPSAPRAPARPMGERKEMKRLILRGKDRGFITFDEINEGLPPDVTTLAMLEDALALLSEAEVEVVDDAAKIVSEVVTSPAKGTLVESTETTDEVDYAEFSKGNDPVRMYLRKMGSVSLLTREGEVEIAKRIEDGEREVLESVLHSSIAIKEIIQIGERLKKGKMRVREVIRDAPDEDDETFDEQGRAEMVVKLIDKIRRHEADNEKLIEQLDTRGGKKVSEQKRKEVRDAIAKNEQRMAEDLAEIKLNKRQIERIIENLKKLIERIDLVDRELRDIERRTGEPLKEL